MKIFMIAGEASGDLHGAGLVREVKRIDPDAQILCWGGDKMAMEGAKVLKHIRNLAFMGFVEVVQNLPQIMRNFKICKQQILEFNPDKIVFIDYPGFNLRMAEWSHKKGIKNAYYIAPQVWAWKEGRVDKIRRYVDELFVILPFEEAYFHDKDIDARYVGHPLMEQVEVHRNIEINRTKLAILPGSRKQEIHKMLGPMIEASSAIDMPTAIAMAPNIPKSFYQSKQNTQSIELFEKGAYHLFAQSSLAVVTSGTATLEAALFNVPQIVVYKANPISYFIAKKFVKVKYISLVNLILDEAVVPELIQNKFNATELKRELQNIASPTVKAKILADYQKLHSMLDKGGASKLVARALLNG